MGWHLYTVIDQIKHFMVVGTSGLTTITLKTTLDINRSYDGLDVDIHMYIIN